MNIDLCHTALGVILFITAGRTLQVTALMLFGVEVEAEVVNTNTRQGDESTLYYLTYRFRTMTGEVYEEEVMVGRDWQYLAKGDRVKVKYSPNKPKLSSLYPSNTYSSIAMASLETLLIIPVVTLIGFTILGSLLGCFGVSE